MQALYQFVPIQVDYEPRFGRAQGQYHQPEYDPQTYKVHRAYHKRLFRTVIMPTLSSWRH